MHRVKTSFYMYTFSICIPQAYKVEVSGILCVLEDLPSFRHFFQGIVELPKSDEN